MDIDIVKSPFDDLVAYQGVRLNIKYLTLFFSNLFWTKNSGSGCHPSSTNDDNNDNEMIRNWK